MQLSPFVDALISVFEDEHPSFKDNSRYQVSRTVSLLAGIYEKARNAVEFRAEHLIRRAAIERILRRRIILGGATNTMAENVVVELLWARYIDSSLIDEKKVAKVQEIIDKYLIVKEAVFTKGNNADGVTWDNMIGLLSSEIEEVISPAKKREALNNFFYQALLPRIHIEEEDEKTVNILTYIAIERAYAQSDEPIIIYHLIKLIQPSWLTISPTDTPNELHELFVNIRLVQRALHHPLREPLYRFVRKNNPPFLLIRDFFLEKGSEARHIIETEPELEHTLSEIATKRYHEIGTKIRRAVVRSIIYIFLTKMVFAFALEAPVDIFITKKIDYLALGVNMILPPFLLFIIAGFLRVPGHDNTLRLIGRIKTVFYDFDNLKNEGDNFTSVEVTKKPMLTATFTLVYIATFLLTFGAISLVLSRFGFNPASQLIFIFFVTLVSFFAYRIRLSAKEYEIMAKHGAFSPIVDFFFLPILRVGRELSNEIARLNVLMFVFDFILEAPLKVIFEFMEEWFRFIRTKKDEII